MSSRPIAVLTAGLFLFACQNDSGTAPSPEVSAPTPVLSLEEAKQISSDIAGRSFTSPPRSINDVLALLERMEISGPEQNRDLLDQLNAPLTDGSTRALLAEYYLKRGRAAGRLGLPGRQLDSLRRAFFYVDVSQTGHIIGRDALGGLEGHSLRQPFRYRGGSQGFLDADTIGGTYVELGWAEVSSGNFKNGIDYIEKAIKRYPWARGLHATLAQMHATAGNLEAASRERDAELDRFKEKPSYPTWAGIQSGDKEAWGAYYDSYAEGAVLSGQGRWTEAEPLLRRIIGAIEAGQLDRDDPAMKTKWRLALTGNLLKQGRLVEAEVVARQALDETLAAVGRHSAHTADAIRGLSQVLSDQGRHREASILLETAMQTYRDVGATDKSLLVATTYQSLGASAAAMGNWDQAVDYFEAARRGVQTYRRIGSNKFVYEKILSRDPILVASLLKSGRAEEALSLIRINHEKNRKNLGPTHHNTALSAGLMAMALAATGRSDEARKSFEETASILTLRFQFDDSMSRAVQTVLIGLILESYVELLSEEALHGDSANARDAIAEAFRIADTMRGPAVRQALAASAARAAARDPELADLVRREQDAEKHVQALYGLLANIVLAPSDQKDAKAEEDLRALIDRAKAARNAIVQEVRERLPEYATLTNPKPATIGETVAALRAGEALVSFYVGENRTYVWAVPKSGEVAFHAVPIGRQALADIVATLRSALEPDAGTLGEIPVFDVMAAYGLYEALLKPVESAWKEARSLIVVAHGPLAYLPFSLLPTQPFTLAPETAPLFYRYRDVPWLARTHAVTNVPAVSSFRTLRGLPPAAPNREAFKGFGDPWFNEAHTEVARAEPESGVEVRRRAVRLRSAPTTRSVDSAELAKLPRLPDTAEELRSIAVSLGADPTTDVFVGAAANEEKVKSLDLSRTKVLAFATHGLLPGDLNGLLQPALALSAPQIANVSGDGLLTLDEILSLKLDADWVVLSACNTAAADGAGADAVSGLGRAFFYAGTRALLVSNWPVETTSAKALTTDIFRRQAADPGLSRAGALRQAMLALIDGPGLVDGTGRSVFSYAHPIFWAPFSLVGDGGGGTPTG